MKRLVKICGLTHAASVDAAIEAGADALGFVFSESIRRVTPRHAAIIANRVPRHVLRVAVMRHPEVDLWREVEAIFCPDVLQTDLVDFEHLEVPAEIVRWPVVREGSVPSQDALPEIFVYEGASSGRGQQVDWHQAATLAAGRRMILAGGLDSANVAAAIRTVSPYGVDVSSAVEAEPGVKDPDLIRAFVAAVRAIEGSDGAGSTLRSIVEDVTEGPSQ